MSEQSNSRYRKQRFPRLERRKLNVPSNQMNPLEGLESDEDSLCVAKRPRFSTIPINTKPFRSTKSDTKDPSLSACRLDKRARDEHNEQERSRRRELAVIYELIRCSFSNNDLCYLGHCNGPKSIDKLSYPQVLQIAYQLSREEQHNLILFDKCLNDLKLIEKEFIRVGLAVPERPTYPSIIENYRKVVQIVDNLLRVDKSARSMDGVYEMTPAERAALGDQELAFLRPRHSHSIHHTYADYIHDRQSSESNIIFNNYSERDDLPNSYSPWHNNNDGTSTHPHMIKRSSKKSLNNTDLNIHSIPFQLLDNSNYGSQNWLDSHCTSETLKYEDVDDDDDADVDEDDDDDETEIVHLGITH